MDKSLWWKPVLNVTGWVLTAYGLFWLIAVIVMLTGMLSNFDFTPEHISLSLSKWLAGVTLIILLMWILNSVLSRRSISLKWPLIILALCAMVMTVLLINSTKSFGPYVSGCSAYPPLSFSCATSFDDLQDFYLLVLLLANLLLLMRFFLELSPVFGASKELHSDILDDI